VHEILLAHDSEKAGKIRTARDELNIPSKTFNPSEPWRVELDVVDLTSEINSQDKWEELFQKHVLSKLNIVTSEQRNFLKGIFISWYFHHRLVVIHPFNDGNGRLARLLMCLLLRYQGLSFMTYPALINSVISEDKTTYLNALNASDKGDYISPLNYMMDILSRSFEITIQKEKGLKGIKMRLSLLFTKLHLKLKTVLKNT
jgi:Fic family protein